MRRAFLYQKQHEQGLTVQKLSPGHSCLTVSSAPYHEALTGPPPGLLDCPQQRLYKVEEKQGNV